MKIKNKPKKHRKKVLTAKGELGAGMTYAILIILIIITGGALMTGNLIPSSDNTGGQPVVTLPAQTKPAKDELQLFTFPGATYTPTPSLTPTPVPTEPPSSGGGGGGNTQPGGSGGGGGGGGGNPGSAR